LDRKVDRTGRHPSVVLWKEEYDTELPHSSLRYKTPAEFSATCVRYVPIDENLPDPASTESANR
jgi:putative transposase